MTTCQAAGKPLHCRKKARGRYMTYAGFLEWKSWVWTDLCADHAPKGSSLEGVVKP